MSRFASPMDALRHHVSGAITRGEKQAIAAITSKSVAVYMNSVSCQEIAQGEFNTIVQSKDKPAFMGDPESAARYLESLPVGQSVETRYYDESGKWYGSRSCMNKPALWADIRTHKESV